MDDLLARIAQFENMAQADPDNEMAHYSLGGAYAQAGRHADAAVAYLRCTAVAPGMSKAYQLAGENFIKSGQKDKAAEALLRGYTIAAERGDLMPKNAIAELLRGIGRAPPETAAKPSPSGAVSLGLGAATAGRAGSKLERPPFRGPVGQWIFENVPKETWTAWIGQGTKVINELRLNLASEQDSATYDTHMREFLGIDDALYEKLTGHKP
jgi:Fe-S cluster biosynthesis and repair protein YggX